MKNFRWIVSICGLLAAVSLPASADVTLTNTTPIVIPDVGVASPYPATIAASGLTGTLTGITVTLTGFSHTAPFDLAALFVGPGGQATKLFDGSGGQSPVSNLTLTFDDAAASVLPANGPLVSGTYRPGQFFSSPFSAPAPSGPYALNFSAFAGAAPNGLYRLFIQDFSPGDSGTVSGGYSITLRGVSANAPAPVPEPAPAAFLSVGALGLLGLAAVRRRRAF